MSAAAADREHPGAEKLSALEANELSPAESSALREHVGGCAVCAERLADLHRFLEFVPAGPRWKGIADLKAAAEWRRLWRRVQPLKQRWLRQLIPQPAAAFAVVLAAALIWSAYRVATLERELAKPITDLGMTTIEASGSRKGEPGTAGPVSLRLGRAVAFETLSDHPYRRYRLTFRDETGRVQRRVEDTEDDDGMITLFLPKRFLAPGRYGVEVEGIEGSQTRPIRKFEIRILR